MKCCHVDEAICQTDTVHQLGSEERVAVKEGEREGDGERGNNPPPRVPPLQQQRVGFYWLVNVSDGSTRSVCFVRCDATASILHKADDDSGTGVPVNYWLQVLGGSLPAFHRGGRLSSPLAGPEPDDLVEKEYRRQLAGPSLRQRLYPWTYSSWKS
ncbi:unnamed protein product [Pleuronectes platessa]|uniref:Uncharacterized protein n=1 Tax=Pleuronectes platessa TaxID=8262 RepID=A0A9N7U362_PLEPL|nr:unnamed protein product [Pleuronectes platessa]